VADDATDRVGSSDGGVAGAAIVFQVGVRGGQFAGVDHALQGVDGGGAVWLGGFVGRQ